MILVDTSVLVGILRKERDTLTLFKNLELITLFTTEISIMELLFGITGNSHYLNQPERKQRRLSEIDELDIVKDKTMLIRIEDWR